MSTLRRCRLALTSRTACLVAGLLILAALLLPALPAAADHHEAGDPMAEALMGMFDRTTGKLTQLAGAIPADHYDWRPADGVYSVSEAIMHVTGANFALSAALGVPRPSGLPEDVSTVTDKAEVNAWLESSIETARGALEKASGEDLGGTVEAFGQEMTRAVVTMIILDHNAEHLGQLIAYGRSNGVVPPWSQPQPAADGAEDEDSDAR